MDSLTSQLWPLKSNVRSTLCSFCQKNFTIQIKIIRLYYMKKRSIVFGKSTNFQQLLEDEGLKNVEQQE